MSSGVKALVITPEMAWRWMTGEDRQLEQQLRELAYAHEDALRADPRPNCKLCHGDCRLDDIPCWRCNGSGKEPAAGKEDAECSSP